MDPYPNAPTPKPQDDTDLLALAVSVGVIRTQTWRDEGLCAQIDPDLWFPEKGESTRAAKEVCAACPVTEECLAYAMTGEIRFGVWGGTSERERKKLKAAAEAASTR
jgi:WhiB family transcriptional regulator, redox-sensing transcriptional regulator